MTFLCTRRGFLIGLIVLAVLFLAELGAVYLSYQSLQQQERRASSYWRDLAGLQGVSPPANEEVALRLEQAVSAYEIEVTRLERSLEGGEIVQRLRKQDVPKTRTDAYFDLVNYAEKLRTLAHQQKVAIGADEYFGFDDYTRAGPPLDQVGLVFRQCQIMEQLLRLLIAQQPTQLISVEREGAAESEEWRDQDRLSLARDGVLATEFVRVRFAGETASLRGWLNGLTEFDLPVCVRSVEVVPVTAEARRGGSLPGGGALVLTSESGLLEEPLVKRSESEFTVVLEILKVLRPTEEVTS